MKPFKMKVTIGGDDDIAGTRTISAENEKQAEQIANDMGFEVVEFVYDEPATEPVKADDAPATDPVKADDAPATDPVKADDTPAKTEEKPKPAAKPKAATTKKKAPAKPKS